METADLALVSLYLIGAAVLFSLGVVGEYAGRIYEQVKARPLYVLKESIRGRRAGVDPGQGRRGRMTSPGKPGDPTMPTPSAHRPLSWYGYVILVLLIVAFAAWGGLVVYRSALL